MTLKYASFINKNLKVSSRSGYEWQCLCPYHEDTSPSFSVNVQRGLFICYACGAKGTVAQLAEYMKTGVVEANDISVIDVRQKIAALSKHAQTPRRVLPPEWSDNWRVGDEYITQWAKRGIYGPTLDLFGLGYNEIEDALVIPVHAPDSKNIVSYFYRYMNPNGGPKYKYQHDFKISHNLYGSWQVRTAEPVGRIPSVAVTEGSIDTLAMWTAGIPSVALLGARVSAVQAKLIRALDPFFLVVMTDRDTAGRQAGMELEQAMRGSGVKVVYPTYWETGAKDPAEMTGAVSRRKAFFSALP